MANGDWDKMNKAGNAGKALLVILGSFAAAGAAKSVSNSKKEQQKAKLQRQLDEVRYELSKRRGNFFREAWFLQEIEELERQEEELLRQINELGG